MPNGPSGRHDPARAPVHARPATAGRPRPSRIAAAAIAVVVAASLLGGVIGGWFTTPAPPVAAASASPGASRPPASGATLAPSPSTPGSSPGSSPAETDRPGPSAAPSPSPGPSPSADPVERLQGTLDRLRQKLSIPGVSVAILWDDGRTWLGVSGVSDMAGGAPVTTDTGFALASISKTFTAAVVLLLVDDGRLRLDEPVAPLLPAFKLDPRITVRMLLDHTSGLPDFFLNPKINAALLSAPDVAWTAARAWAYVTGKRPVPGTTWRYSNTNYMLLGELVRVVTGRPLATEVRSRLLDPLELTAAWYQGVEKPRSAMTIGYRLVAKSGGGFRAVRVAPPSPVMPYRSVVTAAGGAGSIAATALDTARWMRAFAGGRVLPPAIQREMFADVTTTTALKAKIPYGLGIQVVTIAGRSAYGHSGRYLGFRNVVRYLPTEGVTIAVLTNQSASDPSAIAAALLNVFLPPLPSPTPGPSGSPGPSGAPPATAAP